MNLLIIYPHWVPANLAGVHRPRLIGNYLKKFGWNPILVTVDHCHYEETLDWDSLETVSKDIEVHKTGAFPLTKPRIIGDLGLRAFFQLYKKSKQICSEKKIDAIWIPIPSFYAALLGRMLWRKTKIPYGIDYIDPWVRDISNQKNKRAILSQFIAKTLEPIAIKKAKFVTGVALEYYKPAIERNFKISPPHTWMPYGFDPNDHIVTKEYPAPWDGASEIKPWVYAGAFLPNSHLFLVNFFRAIKRMKHNGEWDQNIHLYFIGTGNYIAKSITEYAIEFGLGEMVTEIRERRPFRQILYLLSKADKVMLFGSTEKHYTASKTFQCILSNRPIIGAFHEQSNALEVLNQCKAKKFILKYSEQLSDIEIEANFIEILKPFLHEQNWNPEMKGLAPYSSEKSAEKLAKLLDSVVNS
ncbi:MAG: hypothetical protein KJ941_13330 [Bacteroidetes bacterium]|nr:hypothetical protein [Bacteroidota bacterium]